jgi:hypothetical protein
MLLSKLSTNSSNQTFIIWSPQSHTACKMDTLITYDEVMGFLKHPPTLAPRPDFTRLHALCTHMNNALKQLGCPQSAIHGWMGLVMDPTMYALLEPIPFAIPVNPGSVPAILWTSTTTMLKILTLEFDHNKNYLTITSTTTHNDSVPKEFKVSNNPALTGRNSTMSILDILNHLNTLYVHLEPMTLIQNNALFHLPFCATDAPERLFWCIKQCQEIQVITGTPYSNMQLMTNTVQVLMTSCIFPTCNFKDWEATAIKLYMILKIFIHAAYARGLVAMQIRTSGQQGYAPAHNMHNVLADVMSNTDDNNTVALITQTAAAAIMGSTLGSTYAAPMAHTEYAAAINQLSINQTQIWNQMEVLRLNPPNHVAAPVWAPFQQAHSQAAPQGRRTAPPILSLTVTTPYGGGGYYQGHGGRALGGCEHGQGSRRGSGRNTFSPAGRSECAIFVPGGSQVPPRHIPPMLAWFP